MQLTRMLAAKNRSCSRWQSILAPESSSDCILEGCFGSWSDVRYTPGGSCKCMLGISTFGALLGNAHMMCSYHHYPVNA